MFGTSIYPPREHVFKRISEVKTQITEAIGFKFSEENENVVIGFYFDVIKIRKWYLSQESLRKLINLNKNAIMTFSYTDAYP